MAKLFLPGGKLEIKSAEEFARKRMADRGEPFTKAGLGVALRSVQKDLGQPSASTSPTTPSAVPSTVPIADPEDERAKALARRRAPSARRGTVLSGGRETLG